MKQTELNKKRLTVTLLLLVVLALSWTPVRIEGFDLENGNAYYYWIPTLISEYFRYPVTLKLRIVAILAEVSFEAWAPYTATAKGRQLGNSLRRPEAERTNANKNEAIAYAIHYFASEFYPENKPLYDRHLQSMGLSINSTSIAAGVGRRASDAVLQYYYTDGFNQLGNEGGRVNNRIPFEDYTGYFSVNSVNKVIDLDRWQPALIPGGPFGTLSSQVFIHAQIGQAKWWAIDPSNVRIPDQTDRYKDDPAKYIRKTEEVIDASASLTDLQKMIAEFFDDKLKLFSPVRFMNTKLSGNPSVELLDDTILHTTLFHLAFVDTVIAVWKSKRDHDAVRPFTSVRWLKRGKRILAYGGPFQGTKVIKGEDWNSYLRTDAFPEYPSGTSVMCSVQAQLLRRRFCNDTLDMTVEFPKGSSIFEPGLTPRQTISTTWQTFTDFERDCANSRFWGGVHYKEATEVAPSVGTQIANAVFDKFVREMSVREMQLCRRIRTSE